MRLFTCTQVCGQLLDQRFCLSQESLKKHLEQVECFTYLTDATINTNKSSVINHILATPEPVFIASCHTGDTRHSAENLVSHSLQVLHDCPFLTGNVI